MTDKELNKEICLELQVIAASYFNEHADALFKAYPGKCSYTTTEMKELIAKNVDVFGLKKVTREHAYLNPLHRNTKKKNEYLIYDVDCFSSDSKREYVDCQVTSFSAGRTASVSVGSFRCEFDVAKIFDYTQRFEKLAGVKTKTFVLPEKEEKVLLSFTAVFDKELASLSKCVNKDDLRPSLNYIFLSVERSELAASDGGVLSVFHANIYNVVGDSSCQVLINPKDAAKIKGECYVRVTKDDYGVPVTTITNPFGERFKSSVSGNFPRYWTVYPEAEKDHAFKVADKKEFISFVKKVRDSNRYIHWFTMESAGLNAIKLIYNNQDFDISFSSTIPVCGLLNYSFRVCVNANRILKLIDSFNGEISVSDPELAILFGTDKSIISLCMPNYSYDGESYTGYISKNELPDQIISPVTKESTITRINGDIYLLEDGYRPKEEVQTSGIVDRNVVCIECEPEDVPDYWDHLDMIEPGPASIDASTNQAAERVCPVKEDVIPAVYRPERLPAVFAVERLAGNYTPERLHVFSPVSCRFLITNKGMYYLIA